MKAHFRLEISVQQLHDVKSQEALSTFVASGSELVVNFLDFPEVSVQPQSPPPPSASAAPGGVILYNTCHTAEFEADSAHLEALLPTQCKCTLRHARHIQWSCPCPLTPMQSSSSVNSFSSYAMTNTMSGEVAGYAQMTCRVYPVTAPAVEHTMSSNTSDGHARAPAPAPPPQPLLGSAPTPSGVNGGGGGGKPYIVRVVVDDSKARRNSARAGAAPRSPSGQGRRSHAPIPKTAVNTAPANTFLYTLQYDVAYQLQSTSEFLATTLKHDHARLSAAALEDAAKPLASKIDHGVEQIVRLSNIVLQVANQLIEDNPAPSETGTTRDIHASKKEKESATQVKRNPMNKLPTPKEGTAAYFLTYHVLFQLQCIGANLFYMTAAYHDSLDVNMSTVPKQHVEFCEKLAKEVQRVTHHVNIMIQSAIDGKLGVASPSSPQKKKASKDKKRRPKKKRSGSSSPSSLSYSSSSSRSSSSSSSSASSRRSSSSSSPSSLSSVASNKENKNEDAVPSTVPAASSPSVLTPLNSQAQLRQPQLQPVASTPAVPVPPLPQPVATVTPLAPPTDTNQSSFSQSITPPSVGITPAPVTSTTAMTTTTGPTGTGAEPTPPVQSLSPHIPKLNIPSISNSFPTSTLSIQPVPFMFAPAATPSPPPPPMPAAAPLPVPPPATPAPVMATMATTPPSVTPVPAPAPPTTATPAPVPPPPLPPPVLSVPTISSPAPVPVPIPVPVPFTFPPSHS